jgi:hypothetical protein
MRVESNTPFTDTNTVMATETVFDHTSTKFLPMVPAEKCKELELQLAEAKNELSFKKNNPVDIATAIVDDLLSGGRRLVIEEKEKIINGRGWGRLPMVDAVLKHLETNAKQAVKTPEPTKFNYNPSHPIGTCGDCGEEVTYNVPRLGPDGGFVHMKTGKLLCEE